MVLFSPTNRFLRTGSAHVLRRSGNNNIKTTTPGDDKKIKKIYQDNPGISDEDAFEIF